MANFDRRVHCVKHSLSCLQNLCIFFKFGLGCVPAGMAVDLDFSVACNILSVGLGRHCN